MRAFLWVVLALLTVAVFSPFILLSLIGLLIFISFTVSEKGGRFYQFIWSYIIFFGLNIVLFQLAWLFRISLPMWLPMLLLAGAATYTYALKPPAPKNYETRYHASKWGVAAGLAVCLFVSLPLILNFSYATVLRYSAKTGDDINHLSMIEADRKAGGYVYRLTGPNQRLLDSRLIGYPQGWHVNAAVFENSLLKLIGTDSLKTRLLSFFVYRLAWLFIMIYLAFELFITIVAGFYKKIRWIYSLAGSAAAGAIGLWLVVSVYGYGFQNFVAAVALVCAAVILLCRWLVCEDIRTRRSYILGLALLSTVSAAVWTLPFAICGLIALAAVASELKRNPRDISIRLWTALIFLFLTSLSIIYAVQTSSSGSLSGLNTGGAVPPISIVGLSGLFLLMLALIYKSHGKYKNWLLYISVVVFIEFFLLAVYQQLRFGEIRYYTIKLAYLVAVTLSIILMAILSDYVFRAKTFLWARGAGFMLLLLLLPLVLGLDPRKSAYPIKDSAPISKATAQYIIGLGATNPNIIIPSSNPTEKLLANKLWSGARPYNSPSREALIRSLDHEITK
ncbi:MAG TPA: hypothetical protein VFK97_03290 [Candidatus Saccharimonadales bacterium]|nr:hypothetical protein [Candidatus Saccharimonadales bacterium]